ncbi:MarR family transcriptional regulator [Flavitalea sp. BT771]|uniref:MarR family transcriptional regulator n=1 Tax=Flavitalea sp. BT771 TaxID=3063329 RepID=UPI0026E36453|nr:MarR family transcriptional regulator [Flavitalea sp. BT771]MDO6429032.1 MarR family transcriptional regulator [Flavitalea sp. BT771]MDV6218840.1 MarR family transcriptional regulator [Flavitalea sp. BT771]
MASIYWLTQNKKEVTQILLSKTANIDRMTTSTVLRTLQAKEYVTRAEHPGKLLSLKDFKQHQKTS